MRDTIKHIKCDGCGAEAQYHRNRISGVPSFGGWITVWVSRRTLTEMEIEKDFCTPNCAIKFLETIKGDKKCVK